ncbi:MAG TPA: Uma2 family endonuclease [Blastocatellia bacterium]|nr:Uma2 family endonuclease [Blastocatellia bacterium]
MATVLTQNEQRVILKGVSWETYERLLSEHEGSTGTRFTYDRGTLGIMVLSAKHEAIRHTLGLLVEILAEELNTDVYGLGSTTFRRVDLQRGFEPDGCFYVSREASARGKERIDLTIDPPPDLVIEIDVSHPSLDKFPIFAAVGVPEVWRYDEDHLGVFKLENGQYIESTESTALPGVTAEVLSRFLSDSQHLRRTEWLRAVRQWARTRTQS